MLSLTDLGLEPVDFWLELGDVGLQPVAPLDLPILLHLQTSSILLVKMLLDVVILCLP
ncbi:hypothetical protein D3C84_1311400 [compost metagenome]